MSRLRITPWENSQRTVDDLYADMERRISAAPCGNCPVELTSAFLKLCLAQSCGKSVPCRIGLDRLSALLDQLKDRGLWIYAADMDGAPWCQTDFTGPTALVIGSEGRGVGRLIKEKADFVVSLPLKGKINSLNASVAAGILCYEGSRQRSGLHAVNP